MKEPDPTAGEHGVQYVSLVVSLFGRRLRVDDRTGLAAWRRLWAEHPLFRWMLVSYLVSVTLLATAVVLIAMPG